MTRLFAALSALLLASAPALAQGDLADQIRARLGAPDLGRGQRPAKPDIKQLPKRPTPKIPGLELRRAGSGRTSVDPGALPPALTRPPTAAPTPEANAKLEAFKKGWSSIMSPPLAADDPSRGLGTPDFLRSYGLLKPGKMITAIDAPLYFRYWQSIGLSAAARGDRETVRMAISQLRRLDVVGFVGVRERVIEQLQARMPKRKDGKEEKEPPKDPFNYRLVDRLTQRNAGTGTTNPGTKPPGR